jgi:fluoroquinolone transport system permease protein
MISRIIFGSIKADVKFISRDPMILMAALAPFLLVLFLLLVFPVISDFVLLKSDFSLDLYYPVVAITLISLIPMLTGMVYAFILLDENDTHILQVIAITPAGRMNFLLMRMIVPVVFTFIILILSVLITDSVVSEGWLRTLFISFLLSLQFPFTFLLIGGMAGNKIEGMALSKLTGVFLVAVPLGLLLHHPWNYFSFFSPFYWIAWAWVIENPAESLLYGAISIVITTGYIIVFLRHFLRKMAE